MKCYSHLILIIGSDICINFEFEFAFMSTSIAWWALGLLMDILSALSC